MKTAVAGLAALMLVVGSASPASSNNHNSPTNVTIANPGEVVWELTGGLIDVNNGTQQFDLGGDDEGIETDPDADPVTLSGTVAADGTIHIPANGVSFPTVQLEEGGFNLTIDIGAATDVTGHLNIWTGEMSTNLTLQIRIDTGFLAVCTLNLPMQLSTSNEGGAPYARSGKHAGYATLADDSFAIPLTQRSGLLSGIACPQLEAEFGLPAAAGTNSATLELLSDPLLEFTAVGWGEANIDAGYCEDVLGGQWSNAKGVKSCTTEHQRIEIVTSPVLNTGGSGTNRWRATGQQVTTTTVLVTDSQQGVLNPDTGTGDTNEQSEEIVNVVVEVNVVTCQQGPSLGSNFQNRPLDSPNCVTLVNNWAATL